MLSFIGVDMVTHIIDKIGKNVENFTKKVEAHSSAMASNLIKGGQAAVIAGSLITGAALAEGTVMLKMAENVAELGHQQELLSIKFGLGAEQAGKWQAAADAVGVGADSLGVGFKTLAKNMENLKLLDNTARLKELNKELLAGSTVSPKAAAAIEALQHRADDLARSHTILAITLQNVIAKHGSHSLEAMKARKALDDNSFSIDSNAEKLQNLIATETTATTVSAQHAKAVLDAAAAARPMQVVFNELGVAVNDATGKLRPVNDVMFDVATKMAAMPDGAEKAGMAIKLFGRSGTDLLPLLDQGAAGIQKFMDQAVMSGKVLDDSQVKEATAAYMAHKQLDQAISGITTQLAIAFLPALTKFLEILTPILHNMADWIKHHEKLLSVLIPVAIVVTGIIGVLITLGGIIAMVVGAFMAFGAIAAIAAPALAVVGAAALPVILIIAALAAVALGVWFAITHWDQIKAIAAGVWQAIQDMAGKVLAFFGQMIDGVVKAWEAFWKNPLYYVGLAVGFVIVKVIEIHDKVLNWIGKMVRAAIDWWVMLPDNLIRIFAEMIVAVSSWADKAVPQMLKAGKDLGKQLLDELKKLPGQVVSVGSDIARGVIKGMLSIPGEIAKGAKSFGDGLVEGMRKAISGHSPSELFANTIGNSVGTGVLLGMQRSLSGVGGVINSAIGPVTGGLSVTAHHAQLTHNPKTQSTTGQGGGGYSKEILAVLVKIYDQMVAGDTGTGTGKGSLSPSDILTAFNHMVEAAQIQRGRGTRAGFVS